MRKAVEHARRALDRNDKAPYAHLVLGASFHEKENKAEARKAYERFLSLCSDCRFADDIRAALKSL